MNIFMMFNETNQRLSDNIRINAVWMLGNPIMKNKYERTCKLKDGDLIRIENGIIVDSSEENQPTHIILECQATLIGFKPRIITCNISTLEHEIIKL